MIGRGDTRSRWPFGSRTRERDLIPAPPEGQLALIAALDSVAAAISSACSVHQMLTIIVEAAKRFTGTEKVVVCLVDEYAPDLTLDESTLVVRGSLAEHAQEWWGEHLAAIADDVFSGEQPHFDVDHERGSWLLAVPVRAHDQPLGILVAINAVTHGLLPGHTAFLSILGAFAAISIANARLAEEGRYAMLAGERERIAREMHDGISQSLFSVSLGIELCKKQVRKDPALAGRTLDDLQAQISHSSAELRRLIYDLRPMNLQELGLVGSVQVWLREATRGSVIDGRTEVTGVIHHLSTAQEACLYRVAKEAVSNAVRHSGGSSVVVRFAFEDHAVRLSIHDDGNGFDGTDTVPRLTGTGAGLRNMKERMAAMGGTLHLESVPGHGTIVRASLPLGVE